LQQLVQHLAPGGHFVMSNWQFHTSPRLLGRQAPWSTLNLTLDDVEPGDALLSWERKGRRGLRYVHALDTAEAHHLVGAAGLTVTEVFHADGITQALAEYVVARHG
jgi:tRNA (uracil-5-)-methyltransferase TRM9